MIRCCRSWILILGLSLLAPSAAQAQKKKGPPQGPDPAANLTRANPAFVAAFREVVSPASKSTVRILCDGKDTALGVVVAADGWILTKANDLNGDITCKLGDGTELLARCVGYHERHDLVLLKVPAMGLTPASFSPSKGLAAGSWIACAGVGENPVAFGVVSVATRDVPNGGGPIFTPNPNSGYLGIQMEPTDSGGVKIVLVSPKTPAEQAGIKVNDIIIGVGGKAVGDPDELAQSIQRYNAGDEVTVKILRGDKEIDVTAKLAKRPPQLGRGDFQNSMGSKLSSRRSGYPTILQHDSVMEPENCGGPIVDLDGKVIGINICRAGRTESWAVPSEVVTALLPELKSGKLPPPAIFTPQGRVDAARADWHKIQADLVRLRETVQGAEKVKAAAEKTLADAQEALKKVLADVAAVEKRLAATQSSLKKAEEALQREQQNPPSSPEQKDKDGDGPESDRADVEFPGKHVGLTPRRSPSTRRSPINSRSEFSCILAQLRF